MGLGFAKCDNLVMRLTTVALKKPSELIKLCEKLRY